MFASRVALAFDSLQTSRLSALVPKIKLCSQFTAQVQTSTGRGAHGNRWQAQKPKLHDCLFDTRSMGDGGRTTRAKRFSEKASGQKDQEA